MKDTSKAAKVRPNLYLPSAHPELVKFAEPIRAHPKLEETTAEVIRCMSARMEPGLVLVVGPSGVGKSTLISVLESRYAHTLGTSGVVPRTEQPYAWARAVAPMRKTFDFKDFMTRLLGALGDVLVEKKVAPPATPPLFEDLPLPIRVADASASALRRAVE